ncbi:hypothetical protein RI367_004754 [Sorochytrium milnesiophthora]
MPPRKSKHDAAHAYFHTLLSYAVFVLRTRPGEVVAQTSISSPGFRKDSWEKLIVDGRARGVPNLPNASNIDDWFSMFRDYKRVFGGKIVADKQTQFRKAKAITVDDAQFNKVVAQLLEGASGERQSRRRKTASGDDVDVDDEEIGDDDSDMAEESDEDNNGNSAEVDRSREVIELSGDESSVMLQDDTVDDHHMSDGENAKPSFQLVVPVKSRKGHPESEAVARPAEPVATKKNSAGVTDLTHGVRSIDIYNQTAGVLGGSVAQALQDARAMPPPPPRVPSSISMANDTPQTRVELMKVVASGGQAVIFLARLPLDGNSLVIVKAFYSRPSDHELAGMKAVACTNYAARLIGQAYISREMLKPFRQQLQNHEVDVDTFQYDQNNAIAGWCYERLQGDLENALLSKTKKINNAMKQLVALQIAYFLRGVHAAGYIFRDLKPSNVLLNSHLDGVAPEQVVRYFLQHFPVVKVTDFGLVAQQNQSKKTRAAGTMGYMPPAQMERSDYDKSVDITAYAITVAEVFAEDLMYDASEPDETIEHEFRTGEVQRRMEIKLARHPVYVPFTLRDLLVRGALGKIKDIKPFTDYFEQSLKQLAFAFDVRKSDMDLLSQGVNTPARVQQAKYRPHHDPYAAQPVPMTY